MVLASARGGSAGRIEDGLEQLAWGQTGEFRPQVCQCLRFTTERRLIAYRLPADGLLEGVVDLITRLENDLVGQCRVVL
jgi:hypothetical protein